MTPEEIKEREQLLEPYKEYLHPDEIQGLSQLTLEDFQDLLFRVEEKYKGIIESQIIIDNEKKGSDVSILENIQRQLNDLSRKLDEALNKIDVLENRIQRLRNKK